MTLQCQLDAFILHGASYDTVTCSNPHEPKRADKDLMFWLIPCGRSALNQMLSPEQKRVHPSLFHAKTCRGRKIGKAVGEVIGDREREMFFLQLLATSPPYRRRGYASALVKLATAEVNSQSTINYRGLLT